MGLIVAIGITSFWPVSIGLSIYYLYWKRNSLIIPHGRNTNLILAVAGIILISSFFAYPYSGSGIYHASAIALAPFIVANWRLNLKWINLLAVIQIVFMLVEFSQGVIRPSGLSDNGSSMGISALMALTPINAFAIGLSLSRTALLGFGVFALLRNQKLIYALLALTFVVHVSTQLWTQPERFSFQNINHMAELRTEAINGSSTESCSDQFDSSDTTLFGYSIGTTVENCATNERELRLFGYGYGGYVPATGLIQPHNIYILSVWELGILAIPFWIILSILLWRSRNLYMFIPALLALNVDEWYTLTEGIFFLIVWYQITRELPVGLTFRRLSPIMRRSRRLPATNK